MTCQFGDGEIAYASSINDTAVSCVLPTDLQPGNYTVLVSNNGQVR